MLSNWARNKGLKKTKNYTIFFADFANIRENTVAF